MDMLQSSIRKPLSPGTASTPSSASVGALIDNDRHLTTPRDLRLGSETAAVHALSWVKKLKEMRGADGPSFLAYVLDEARKQPHVHGPGCDHDH
jgi:hypothetical protein